MKHLQDQVFNSYSLHEDCADRLVCKALALQAKEVNHQK